MSWFAVLCTVEVNNVQIGETCLEKRHGGANGIQGIEDWIVEVAPEKARYPSSL